MDGRGRRSQGKLGLARPVESFIRRTGVTAGLFNFVLNPLLAWLGNRSRAEVPLTGAGSAAVDTVITCLILSFLVTLFISADTRRALRTGTLETGGRLPRTGPLLGRLPGRPWQLGLILGLVAALVVTAGLVGLSAAFGVTSFPFLAFALLKAGYTPLLAYVVARWVILRQLTAAAA